jgi:hypothetical protein
MRFLGLALYNLVRGEISASTLPVKFTMMATNLNGVLESGIDVDYSWLSGHTVEANTAVIGSYRSYRDLSARNIVIECRYRSELEFARIGIEGGGVWTKHFENLNRDTYDSTKLRLCALIHEHVLTFRRDFVKANDLDINLVDNFSKENFMFQQADEDGCRTAASHDSSLMVCERVIHLDFFNRACATIDLLVPKGKMADVAKVAWDLSSLGGRACVDLDAKPIDIIPATELTDTETVVIEGGERIATKTFVCEKDELGKFGVFFFESVDRSGDRTNTFHSFEFEQSRTQADSYCSQIYEYITKNSFMHEIYFGASK